MPKQELPGLIKKRKILYESKDKSLLEKYGDLYFDARHIDDALTFYERAQSAAGLGKVEEFAVKNANLLMYKNIAKIRKISEDTKIVNDIGSKALELGKLTVAKQAFKEAGNEVMLKKVENLLEAEKPVEKTE